MEPLELARSVLLIVHLVGTSAIVGAFILMMPRRTGFDFSPMLVGSIVQLVSGIALIAVREWAGAEVDQTKMIVKLGIALVVLVLVVVLLLRQRRLRRENSPDATLRPLLYAAGFCAIANIVVAVLWR
jgi:hypothetical protein